jgi:hypothetical protein
MHHEVPAFGCADQAVNRGLPLFVGLTVALASMPIANSVDAQNVHSWVSSAGTGTACTRPAPCATFSIAQNVRTWAA